MKYQLLTKRNMKILVASLCLVTAGASAQQGPASEMSENTKLASAAGVSGTAAANPKDQMTNDFVIGNEDVLAISVWKEPEVSRSVAVRSDGKITLPLMGELVAAGKTPTQLQVEITSGLRPYIAEPAVTVMVQEIKSKRFNILGHIQRPGAYPLNPPMTIVDAISLAGGLRDFAKAKNIYVLRARGDGKTLRIPFNYKDVIRGIHPEQNVQIEPHDTIFVP